MESLQNILVQYIPLAAMAVTGLLLCALLARYFIAPWRGEPPAKARAKKLESAGRALGYTAAALVLSRLLIYAIALGCAQWGGALQDFLRNPADFFIRWDANHYLNLARNWYVNEGDARLHLVFFPLYPLMVRGVCLATGLDALIAGLIVSNVCLLGCGWALFRLAEMDHGAHGGRRAVRYLMFAPFSLFFSIPYSESAFLLMTLLSVLMARRRKLGWAIVFGALAANARILGLLTAVPVFYECLIMVREKKGGAKLALQYAMAVSLIALGFLAYLGLNAQITGDPLRFLTYQSEHWSQKFGSLYNTLKYTLNNAAAYGDAGLLWGTWRPQAVYILLSIVLLARCWKRTNAGDAAYALLYIYMAIAPTWLLSGARYLTALYAVYPMMAGLANRRSKDWAIMALNLSGMAYVTFFYVAVGSVL